MPEPHGQRLDVDLADGVLAVAAGLFDVAAASGGRPGERLAQGDTVGDGVDLDAVAGAQPVQCHVQVGFPEAPQDDLVGVLVLFQAHGRVLGDEACEALGELVLVGFAVRLDGERQQGVGHRPRPHQQGRPGSGQCVAGLRAVQPGDADEITGDTGGDGPLLSAEGGGQCADADLGLVEGPGLVAGVVESMAGNVHRVVRAQGAGEDAYERELLLM